MSAAPAGELGGRVALVTGASRQAGIGAAVARELAAAGADVAVHHHRPHDAARPWGADPGGMAPLLDAVRAAGPASRVVDLPGDLTQPEAPDVLVAAATDALGALDVLVANHASSGPDGTLADLDAAMLDDHWAVSARATILLVQAFARRHDGRPGGRVIVVTSGQDRGPMPGELAYAASKGALTAVLATLADELAEGGITVNCVNPGPTDTGWASPERHAALAERFGLGGRWSTADEAAGVIRWLAGPAAARVTGQVLHAEGGFRR